MICPIPVRTWVGSVIHEPPPPERIVVVVVRTTHVCVRRKQHENMCVARVCESSPGPQQSEWTIRHKHISFWWKRQLLKKFIFNET